MKKSELTKKDIFGATIFFTVTALLIGLGVWFEYAKVVLTSALFSAGLKTTVIVTIVLRLVLAIIKVAKKNNDKS